VFVNKTTQKVIFLHEVVFETKTIGHIFRVLLISVVFLKCC